MNSPSVVRTYIYGAGNVGRSLAEYLRVHGQAAEGFIDQRGTELGLVAGLPCYTTQTVPQRQRAYRVLVAVHNPGVNVAKLRTGLQAAGCQQVLTLPEVCRETGFRLELGYWLDVDHPWSTQSDLIAQVSGLWADARSREVFGANLALRLHDSFDKLPVPTPKDQYFPLDLPRWNSPLRLLDGGAFDGDTLRVAREAGYSLEQSLAIEPDPLNASALTQYLERDGLSQVQVVRAGLAAEDSTAFISGGGGSASRLAEKGTAIELRSIDSLCREFSFFPSLIKLDIEGAERAALEGAATTLARGQTELALAVYHLPDDLLTLPDYLATRYPGLYRYYLRSHAENGFETILYAQLAAR